MIDNIGLFHIRNLSRGCGVTSVPRLSTGTGSTVPVPVHILVSVE